MENKVTYVTEPKTYGGVRDKLIVILCFAVFCSGGCDSRAVLLHPAIREEAKTSEAAEQHKPRRRQRRCGQIRAKRGQKRPMGDLVLTPRRPFIDTALLELAVVGQFQLWRARVAS